MTLLACLYFKSYVLVVVFSSAQVRPCVCLRQPAV